MIIQALAFYMFASVLIGSSVLVIVARNPVHSVLFLILTFFNAAALFVILGAEFLAMILVIVYVGAVAVLFMFVVMMLNINFVKLREGFLQYLPIGAVVGLILVVELVTIFLGWVFAPGASDVLAAPIVQGVSNTAALGKIIYTDYIYLFQAAGMILLVAMVGAIVLTLRRRTGVRRQDISAQVSRRREDVVEVRQVSPGSGA